MFLGMPRERPRVRNKDVATTGSQRTSLLAILGVLPLLIGESQLVVPLAGDLGLHYDFWFAQVGPHLRRHRCHDG